MADYGKGSCGEKTTGNKRKDRTRGRMTNRYGKRG